MQSINKDLIPLVKEDEAFLEAPPPICSVPISQNGPRTIWTKSSRSRQQHYPPDLKIMADLVMFFGEATPWGGARPEEGVEAPHSHHTRPTQGENLPVSNRNSQHTLLFKKDTCISKYSVNPECNCSQGHHTPAKTIESSWTAGTFHNQLAKVNKGPVGPEYNNRVRDRICLSTLPIQKTPPKSVKPGPARAGISGDLRDGLKRGSHGDSNPSGGRFLLHSVSCTKKRWGSETSDKLEKSQFFHRYPPLQDGGNPYPQKPTQKRRLACNNRLEGRLFLSPDKSKTQEVSLLPIQRKLIPIQLPPLPPGLSPMGLYQDPEANSSSRTRAGDTVGGIHRRHSPDGRDQGEGQGPCVRPDISFPMPRIHNKPGEDDPRTIPAPRIPGFHGRHHQYGAEPPNSENKKDSGGVSTTIGGGACDMPRPLKVNWQNECHKPSDSTSSSFLQELTNRPGICPQEREPGIRNNPSNLSRQQGGTNLVGHADDKMEWQDGANNRTRPDHRVRCLNPGLGSLSPEHQHRGTLVSSRKEMAYKLLGTASGDSSIENIHQTQNRNISVNEDRQHNSCYLYQQPRWDSVQGVDIPDPGPMDVVPGEEYSHSSSVPTWCNEPDSGQGVEIHEGQVGLEPGPLNLPKNQQTLWTTGSGPICIQTHQSVPPLLQLAARSNCRGNRRIPPGLEDNQRLCQPTMESDPQGANENTNAGSGCNPGSSSLEDTAMVLPPTIVGSRLATPITQTDTQYRVSTHNATTSRVEHLRESLSSQGLSGQATELILNSWRSKTSRSYDSLFGRWNRWCSERGSDPFSGPISEVANFLASLYKEGYQYNSVNAYRSAISSVHDKADGVPVGQHPIITRLIKGIFNVRPPIPRYSNTWDVQLVLNFLQTQGKSETLPLKMLTLKNVFLLAITRPSRSADLSQLDTSRMRSGVNGVSFIPSTLAKQSRQDKPIESFFFPSFPQNPTLCPVRTLSVYLDKTNQVQGSETKLFLSFIKPHKAVTSSTIARWLRTILEQAGIDTEIFSAHSTRGA